MILKSCQSKQKTTTRKVQFNLKEDCNYTPKNKAFGNKNNKK